ncbi:hypothetical protein [Muriicola sp. Z0-33]|uniref:hypothetical protein n=1 Tax=Muriicola sp. Z0-33 TaxID=2816957 RepID=UPI0022385ED7|nr:hypothetical protein [Muriicola sp. Z0-33]MCW5515921.1 hypothetical protein [Muriicola sp. Z0-33]
MAQDLRELFKKDKEKQYMMKEGHEKRFEELLNSSFPKKRRFSSTFLRIAASVVIVVSIGFFTYRQLGNGEEIKTTVVDKDNGPEQQEGISLGDLSPDLKVVENYYVANINLELSQLEISDANKDLVDQFMERLAELNAEYKRLNKELNEIGPNDQTINALIKNLQLRLQMLQKLKNRLNELKSSKNEQVTANSV